MKGYTCRKHSNFAKESCSNEMHGVDRILLDMLFFNACARRSGWARARRIP
jgi:hypothetical protein